jgi:hypothetical protein
VAKSLAKKITGKFMKRGFTWDALLACAALLALLMLFQIGWNITRKAGGPDPWTVLSAIGTVAATIVALFVAFQTSQEKVREQNIRARLAAAQLAPLLVFQIGTVKNICARLDQFIEVDPNPLDYGNLVQVMSEVLKNEPSFETLRAVAPLPNDCAERIASGFAQLKLAYQMLDQAADLFTRSPALSGMRRSRSGTVAGLSKGVLDTLQPALEICNEASKIKIGGPAVK